MRDWVLGLSALNLGRKSRLKRINGDRHGDKFWASPGFDPGDVG